MFFIWLLAYCISGVIWGIVTKKVNEGKGYDGGFWWGFFLGIIGLIVVLCKSDCHTRYYGSYDTRPSESIVSYNFHNSSVGSGNDGRWKCAQCGVVNSGYSCQSCGILRGDNTILMQKQAREKMAQRAEEEKERKAKELAMQNDKKAIENATDNCKDDNIQKIKEYKSLLDLGILTQEEFDKKKKELLDL